MRKPTILRTLIFVLAMLFNFATYAQDLIAYNSKFDKNLNENLFLKASNQLNNPFSLTANADKTNATLPVPIIVNPVIKYAQGQYAGVVSVCPNDGKELPKLFLCGSNDSRLIETDINNATSIIWQQRTGGCPAMANTNCANEASSCTWTQVGTGPDYNANTAGEFRLRISYFDGTVFIFYFNVYKNDLDPTAIVKSDIVKDGTGCTIPGKLIAGGFSNLYEYSFTTAATPSVWQDSNTFAVNTAGTYNIFMRLRNVPGTCVFNVKGIVVSAVNFASTAVGTQPKCATDKGSIKIITNDVNSAYQYVVTKDGAAFGTFGAMNVPSYTLNNLDPGVYQIVTSIDKTCATDTQSVTITAPAPLAPTFAVNGGTSCAAGDIQVTPAGGTSPYTYMVSINNGPFVTSSNSLIAVSTTGKYVIKVIDANLCEFTSAPINIATTSKPNYTIITKNQDCTGGKPSITFNMIDDHGYTVRYSIDNGANYQNQTSYTNLKPGDYFLSVRTGTKSSNYCYDTTVKVTLLGNATALTASGGVAALAGCGLPGKTSQGLLRITNPQGGVAPFKYSFDGKVTWVDQKEMYVDPSPSPFTLYIKDALGCEYAMPGIKLDPKPADPEIELTPTVYNCDGTGTRTATIKNTAGPGYAYQYTIDGRINNNVPPNIFTNIPVGTHTVGVDYKLLSVPTYSNLLKEDFGSGDPTTSPGIAAAYCFNNQDANVHTCPNPTRSVEDNQYSVASFFWRSDDPNSNNSGAWFHFKDHTTNPNNLPGVGDANGRFLLVNVGDAAGNYGVLYSKDIDDVIPNQLVQVDVAVANLLNAGKDGDSPALLIQLVDPTGYVVAQYNTGAIAASKNDPNRTKWVTPPTINLDPGANTKLKFVIRSGSIEYFGNDLLIDDIWVRQLPKSCVNGATFDFEVLPNKKFTAKTANINAVKCSGGKDGSFQIIAENFNTTDGFDYSLDGGLNWYNSKVGTVDFPNANFPDITAKTYNIKVRYSATTTSCDVTLPTTVGSPAAFVVDASATVATCASGATVKATAVGGITPYTFVLTNKADGTTQTFNAVNGEYILTGVKSGTYTVSGSDKNLCADNRDTDLVINATPAPTADIAQDTGLCFGTSGAQITVNINGGVGPFSYKVSRDLGLTYTNYTPTFTARTFTHPAPTTGTYDFVIKDANGCEAIAVSQKIDPKLTAKTSIKNALSCKTSGTDATIEVEILNGTSPYKYIIKDSAGATLFTSGVITNPIFQYTTGTAGKYTFEITDKNNCPFSITEEVKALDAITAQATTHDVTCFGSDNGYVDLEALTGAGQYTYQFNGTGPFTTTTHYGPLAGTVAGTTYSYTVKDANDCEKTFTFKIYQPADIYGTAVLSPYTCAADGKVTVSGVGGGTVTGTVSYKYTLLKDGIAVQGPQSGLVFNSLTAAGVYTVKITDANGCPKTIPAGTIVALDKPAGMTITTTTAATCPTNKGSVTITNVVNAANAAVSTAGLEYRITSPITTAYQSSNVFNGLDAGTLYTFEVRDANKCTTTKDHTILTPSTFTVSGTPKSVTCFNANDGSIVFTVTGIAAGVNYSYKVDTNTAQTGTSTGSPFTISAPSLGAGLHGITVTNSTTNCPISASATVGGPTVALALDLPTLTHVTCKAQGTATINAKDGSGTYTYTVTRTAPLPAGTAMVQLNNNLFTGLVAGNYSVSVKDITGCTVSGQTFTINDAVKPSAVISGTSNYCVGTLGATLTATPSAAPQPNPDYEYSLNGGAYQDSGSFTGLGFGDYTITVRDKVTGCTADLAKQSIATPITAGNVILNGLSCKVTPDSPDALIKVTVSGGYPNYSYKVNTIGAPFTGISTPVGTGLTTFNYNAPTDGIYYFEITDNKGCTITTSAIIAPISKPTLVGTPTHIKCMGDNTGSISVKASPIGGTYEYSKDNGVTYQTSNVFNGLLKGTYKIVVKDVNSNCPSLPVDVTVNEPASGITATAIASKSLKCDATNNSISAEITVTASGGTPYPAPDLYRYSYNSQTPVTSNKFQINVSGNVTVEVFDSNNCSVVVTGGVDIDPLDKPTVLAIADPNPITCETGHDKTSLTLTVTKGVLPFTYEITSPTTTVVTNINSRTYTFNNLGYGHYYFKVTDKNGCTITNDKVIDNVVGIQSTGSIVSNVTCNGANNGSIKFVISGNTAPTYSYTLVGSVSGPIAGGTKTVQPVTLYDVITYTGLKGGETYTFTVANDDTKCPATSVVTLAEPLAITSLNATATKVYCSVPKTDIKVTASGGNAPLYFAVVKSTDTPVFPTDYNTTGIFNKDTSVDGINFTAYVTDKNGNCRQSMVVPLVRDAQPTINPAGVICYSGTQIPVTISGSVYGGTALYGLDGSYDTNPIKNINGPGTYTLGIKDNNGCEKTTTLVVNDKLTIKADIKKELSCQPITPPIVLPLPTLPSVPAEILLSAGGGDNTSYTWEYKFGSTGTYTPLTLPPSNLFLTPASGAGDYYFKVTSAGCSIETMVTIKEPVMPEMSITQTQFIKCHGDETGAIDVVIDYTKGVAPYTIKVERTAPTYQNYGTQTYGLAAGTYTVTLTDGKGCIAVKDDVIVKDIDPITFKLDKVNIQCTGGAYTLGSILVQDVKGGTAPFTYYVTNNFGDVIPNSPHTVPVRDDYTFSDIINFGVYTVTVIDANGCQLSDNITMTSPPQDLEVVIDTSAPNCSAGKAVVTVKASPLGTHYTFGIFNSNMPPFAGSFQAPDVAGGDTSTFNNLIPGVTYTFVVHDGDTGCDFVNVASIPIPGTSTLLPVIKPQNVSCIGMHDGGFSFNISGYNAGASTISYQVFGGQTNLPVTGVLTYNVGATQPVYYPAPPPLPGNMIPGDMYPGLYYIVFTENGGPNNGCRTASDLFYIKESSIELSVKAISLKNENCNKLGVVKVQAQDGMGPYSYQVINITPATPAPKANDSGWDSATLYDRAAGTYNVYAKDANGCVQQALTTVTIVKDAAPSITAPAVVCIDALPATVTVTGGVFTGSSISYAIGNGPLATALPGVYQSLPTFTISAAGTYTFFVMDDNQCVAKAEYIVNSRIKADLIVQTPLGCPFLAPSTPAVIHGEVSLGTGTNYKYRVKLGTTGTYSAPITINNPVAPATLYTFDYTTPTATAGDYIFEITDGQCPILKTVTVKAIVPTVFTTDVVDVKCKTENTGSIIVSVTSADFPVEYKLDKTDAPFTSYSYKTTNRFDNLTAGTYTVTVRNSLLCETEKTGIIISEPVLALAGSANVTQPICDPTNLAHAATVVLTATASTGTSPYTYSFDGSDFGSDTSYTVYGTPAGRTGIPYKIQDANGCEISGTVDINPFDPPTGFVIDQKNVITCDPAKLDTDVEIKTVVNGVGPLKYSVIPAQTPAHDDTLPLFKDLAAGDYEFVVTDVNGCFVKLPYTIKDVTKIDITQQSLTDISCATDTNGKASFVVSGFGTGAGTYNYVVTRTPGGIVQSGSALTATSIDLINLASGSYRITVQDEETLCSDFVDFSIAAPLKLKDLASLVTPLGCSTPGAFKVVASDGWGSYVYTVTQPDATILPSNTDGIFKDLIQSGTYSIAIKDANGCVINDTFKLDAPVNPSSVATVTYCHVAGDPDSPKIVVTASSTSLYALPGDLYDYSIDNGGNWQSTNTFINLAPGDYNVLVRDKFGCKSVAELVTIKGQIYASAAKGDEIFCGTPGTINIQAIGGYPAYTYTATYTPAVGATVTTGPFPFDTPNTTVYSVNGAGSYVFNITDTEGCPVTTTAVIMVAPTPINFTVTPTSPYCSASQGNMNNGQILVNMTVADNGPYKYTIQRVYSNVTSAPTSDVAITQDVPLFTGLEEGNYEVTVLSGRDCTNAVPVTTTIAIPTPVVAAAKASPFTCTTANTRNKTVVTLTATGGAGATPFVITDYTYSEDNSDWKTSNEFDVYENVTKTAQTLTYYVRDKNGCTDAVQITVQPFPELISATPSLVDLASCTNSGQEKIRVDIVGGAGGTIAPNLYNFEYQVSVDGANYGTAIPVTLGDNFFEYTAPAAGHSYLFKITDKTTTCTFISTAYKVELYDIMKVTASASSMVTCNGLSDGKITINVEDYKGIYDYKVLLGTTVVTIGTGIDAATNNPYTITGIGAGNGYTVEVHQTGYPGCTVTTLPVDITQPSPVDISLINIKVVNRNCHNSGATITVDPTTITGGTGSYEYAFVDAGTTPADSDYSGSNSKTYPTLKVAPLFDSYDVYVRDANKCPQYKNVHVSVDPLPTITSVTPVDHCADGDGYRLDVVATGLAPLQYSLDGVKYQTDSFFTVFTSGNHTVWVKDKNDCTALATASVTILEPLTLDAKVVLPNCKNSDGTVTLTATGGTVTPTNSYVYIKDGGAPQPSNFFSGLAPGDYKFTVKDIITGCTKDIDVKIDMPSDIIGIVATPRPVSCYNGTNGGISVKLGVYDNPIYLYSIAGPISVGPQQSPEFNNLPYGTYTVTVTSGRGCTDSTVKVDVTQPPLIVVSATHTEFGCATGTNTTNDATITASAVGGSGKYLVYQFLRNGVEVQNSDSNVYTVTNHAGGNYTVNVFDENNCNGTSAAPITIAPFATLDELDFTVLTPITCKTDETVQVNVATTGTLMGPLEYTLSGTNGTSYTAITNNTGKFSGLGIGQYMVTVFNPASGCTIKGFHYVFDPNTFTIEVAPTQTEVCYGTSDGKVDLTFVDNQPTPSNDAGAFNYTITGPMPTITGSSLTAGPVSITGLIAGQYTVVASLVNKPECTVTNIFQITQAIAPLALEVVSTRITCAAGGNDGTITLSATGGWPGYYKYELVGPVSSAYSDKFFFDNLTPGHYIVNVMDAKGCIDSDVVDLKIPDPITFTAVPSTTTLTCYGDRSATITVGTPTGGQGTNYLYTISYPSSTGAIVTSGPQESNVFDNLGAGTYTITVTDGFSCSGTSATVITIAQPIKVVPSLTRETGATCLNSATLRLSAVGGTAPYTYSEDGITYSTASFNSYVIFPATTGEHQYFVKDNLGCVSEISNGIGVDAVVPLDIALDLRFARVNCTGDFTAMVIANATGGLGNYQYSLLDNLGNEIRPAQTDGLFEKLSAGTYKVHVVSVDCVKDAPFTVTESPNPLIASYQVFPAKCYGEKNGSIVITASGGTGVIKYAIEPHLDQFVDSGVFNGLEGGKSYVVLVQDILGCNGGSPFTIFVDQPTILRANVVGPIIQEICDGDADGSFAIEILGGNPPYSVSLDNANGTYLPVTGSGYTFSGLKGGIHKVFVKDATCTAEREVNMDKAVILKPTAKVTYDCINDKQANMVEVKVDASNIDLSQIDYSLDSNLGPWLPSSVFTNVAPGKHVIWARHTNGCMLPTAEFTIDAVAEVKLFDITGNKTEINYIEVKATGGIAPYEYSFNEEAFTSSSKYRIYKTADYKVIVRDVNGCTDEITAKGTFIDMCMPNYFTPDGDGQQDEIGPDCGALAYKDLTFDIFDRYGRVVAKYHVNEKWNGKYNGEDLPTGDYWYVLKLNDEKDAREFVGHFTLYR